MRKLPLVMLALVTATWAFPVASSAQIAPARLHAAGDGLADSAEPDDDDMVAERVAHASGLPVVQDLERLTGNEQVRQHGDCVDEGREPDDDDRDREDSAGGVERMDFVVTDRHERDDGHVDAVDPAEAVDDDVADRREQREGGDRREREPQPVEHDCDDVRILAT